MTKPAPATSLAGRHASRGTVVSIAAAWITGRCKLRHRRIPGGLCRGIPIGIVLVPILLATPCHGQQPGLGVRLVDVASPIETASTAWDIAWGGTSEPQPQQDVSQIYAAFDLAGDDGTFGFNAPYPDGTRVPGDGNDFVVVALGRVTIPAGRWQVAFGSDDGGMLALSGVRFLNEFNEEGPPPLLFPGDDVLRFEAPRSHQWTGGTLQVEEPTTAVLSGVFFERGGMDSFEIAIRDASAFEQTEVTQDDSWTLLADGALGWKVTTDVTPGRRIGGQYRIGRDELPVPAPRPPRGDLNYRVDPTMPLVFDINGRTPATDQLGLPANPNPAIFRQVLDFDNVSISLGLISGTLRPGDRLTLVDRTNVDEIRGTPTFDFPFGQWDTSAFNAGGQIEFLSGAPALPAEAPLTKWNRPAGGNWSDAWNWDAGIPNGPGEVAVFDFAFPAAALTITLDQPVTLKGIRSDNPRTLQLTGTEAISLASAGAGPSVQLGSTAGGLRITSPLDFPDSALRVDVSRPSSEVRLDGSISPRSTDMIKEGPGRLVLAGDSQTWEGSLAIHGGALELLHPHGLGSSAVPTRLMAGRIAVQVATEEPFEIAGGRIELYAPTGNLTLGGGIVEVQSDVPIQFSSVTGQRGEVHFPQDHGQPIALPGAARADDQSAIALIGIGTDPNPFLDRVVARPISMLSPGPPLLLGARGAELRIDGPLTAENNVTSVEVVEGMVQLTATSTYTGQTIVRNHGTLTLTDQGTLGISDGSARTGTLVLAGGTFDTLGAEVPENEWVGVDGGRVGGFFAGPVHLLSDSTVLSGNFRGPITGDASVVFSNVPHVLGTALWEANTFPREVIVAGMPEHVVEVRHPQALGTADVPVRLIGGQLHLLASTDRPIVAEGGELHIHQSDAHRDIVLSGGALLGGPDGLILTTPIRLDGATSRIATVRPDRLLSIDAPIEGKGDLRVGGINSDFLGSGPVLFNEAPTFEGNLLINGNEVHFNVPPDITGMLILDRDPLNPNVAGRAIFTVDAEVALKLRGGHLQTIGSDVLVTATNPVVEITGGSIEANLAGAETLLIDAPQEVYFGNLGRSDAEIVIQHGTLRVTNPIALGDDSRGVVVAATRNATFHVEGIGGSLSEPITLGNARGTVNRGGLRLSNTGVLAGDLTVLGEHSVVGVEHEFTLAGTLRGDAFSLTGPGTLRLTRATQHTGATRIGYGDGDHPTLSIVAPGRLSATSQVELYDRGELHIDKRESPDNVDLIEDTIPIQLHGGRIILESHPSTEVPITEQMGPVTAVAGVSELVVRNPRTNLAVQNLARQPGATVVFQNEAAGQRLGEGTAQDPRIDIGQAPTLRHGILGGWGVVANQGQYDFATLDPSGQHGVRALSREGRPERLAAATEDSHVLLKTSEAPLRQNATIASLVIDNRELENLRVELGGNQLTIGTGGILASHTRYLITGGILTAGGAADSSLFVHGFGDEAVIDAGITDGPGGETSLVKSGEGYLYLRGRNTYRGDTIVNQGILFFDRPEALPRTTDVVVTRGNIWPENSSVARVASVTVHSGFVQGLHADSYLIESGSLSETFGNGTITKTSPNHAWVSLDGFAGTLDIQQGLVSISNSRSTSPAIFVREEGVLELTGSADAGSRPLPHRITLDGGQLSAHGGTFVVPDRIDPPVQVASDSRISVSNEFGHLRLDRGLDLGEGTRVTVDGPGALEIEGHVQVHGPATLEHLRGRVEMRGSWLADESVESPHITLLGPKDDVLPDELDFTLMGDNRGFHGSVSLQDLSVRVTQPFALGAGPTVLQDGSRLVLETPNVTGNVVVAGGELVAGVDASFIGSITSHSILSPGASPGRLRVEGSFDQQAEGRLIMDIASPLLVDNLYAMQHDVIEVTGLLSLDGRLEVRLLHGYQPQEGDTFDLFDFDQVEGAFSLIDLPPLAQGLTWDLSRLYTSGELALGSSGEPPGPVGDIDGDRRVGFSDFLILSASFGQPAVPAGCCGDLNRDGLVSFPDFLILSANFGQSAAALAAVPEPAATSLLYLGGLLMLAFRPRRTPARCEARRTSLILTRIKRD